MKKKLKKSRLISRRESITKIGLSTLSATTMMILLNNPARADWSNSPDLPPQW